MRRWQESQQHLPSPTPLPAPCTAAHTAPAPQAGPQELLQAHPPGSCAVKSISAPAQRIWPFLCTRIQPGRGTSRCVHARSLRSRTAGSRGMFSLSSPGGLDTLLSSHCFSKEKLFIIADPWGKSFSLSLSHAFTAWTGGKEVFLHLNLPADRHRERDAAPRVPACTQHHPSIAPPPAPTASQRRRRHRQQRARRRAPANAQANPSRSDFQSHVTLVQSRLVNPAEHRSARQLQVLCPRLPAPHPLEAAIIFSTAPYMDFFIPFPDGCGTGRAKEETKAGAGRA